MADPSGRRRAGRLTTAVAASCLVVVVMVVVVVEGGWVLLSVGMHWEGAGNASGVEAAPKKNLNFEFFSDAMFFVSVWAVLYISMLRVLRRHGRLALAGAAAFD